MKDSWKTTITKLLQTRKDNLSIFPDSEVLNLVFKCVDVDNYYQLTHELGKSYTETCLKFFQDIEDYETCAIIIEEIQRYNKQNGTEITLNV